LTAPLPGGSVQPKTPTLCQSDEKPRLPHFAPKELQIVEMVTAGYKNRDVARMVGTTEQTIKNYLKVIYDKTGVDSRLQLALWWMTKKPQYIAAGIIAG
jgi:DNA-binding NarL/FixJ family response regulator